MKKIVAILLAVLLVVSLVACGSTGNESGQGGSGSEGSSQSGGNSGGGSGGNAENTDPNAPVSSVKNAAGRGSYIKHKEEDAQELLVSMGLPEYPDGEILYANQFEDDNSGTVYIKDTTLDECVSYCQSLSGVSPAYADSNSNGKYVKYTCKNDKYEFTIKFFEKEQERSYTSNGEPAKDVWQAEIDFTPLSGGTDAPGGPVIAEGWEIPEYPYGELVYTKYDENGAVVSLYFNNTTLEECHAYCKELEALGYLEVMNPDIHEDSDGLGKYIMYGPMHPSSYTQYVVSYEYSNMEHTVDTPDGEVAYQVVISNRGK